MTHLHDLRGSAAWETSASEPVISFVLDTGEVVGWPFFHLAAAHYSPEEERLSLQWPTGIIAITGAKALAFYREFAKHKASWCKADGQEITSVVLHRPQPAEA